MAKSVSVPTFRGLDLLDDPQEIGLGGATDLLNVDLSTRGRVRSRDGSSLVQTSASANALVAGAYFKTSAGVEWVVVSAPTGGGYPIKLSDGSTGTTDSSSLVTAGQNSFARFGTPSTTVLYVSGNTFRKYDGSTWAAATGPGIAVGALAVTPTDNRLVCAAISDLQARVYFSNAGAPETWGANNFVGLWPGDGEAVTAIARWRDLLFAFKASKYAVFYGNSTDGSGNPVFNYRGVDAGQGASVGAAVAGDEGLYFVNRSGVYVTTGGDPVYLSQAIEPWVRAGSYGSLPSLSLTSVTMAYLNKKLYVNDTTNRTTLVYDVLLKTWTVWQLGASCVVGVPTDSAFSALHFGDNATKKLAKLNSAVTTDNGVAIASRYRTGFWSPGAPGAESWVREVLIDGFGVVTVKTAVNDATTLGSGLSVTLGTAPAVGQGRDRRGFRGRNMSLELSASSGAWSVSGVTPIVWGQRAAGLQAA